MDSDDSNYIRQNECYKCLFKDCNAQFKRKDRLDIHVRSHTGERPYVCTYQNCNKSYARQQHLSRHISRTHDLNYKERLKKECTICCLQLANQKSLNSHMQSQHGVVSSLQKLFECTEKNCSEKFHKKRQLVAHRLTHSSQLVTAQKCYSCPHEGCNKSFTFPNKLKHHVKIHLGYPCQVQGCSQIFSTWTLLRKHKAADHAQVPTCHVCQATFQQKSNLTQHIKIHATTREPLVCPKENCGRIFFYKKNVQQHILEHHEGVNIWRNKRQRKVVRPHKQRKAPEPKSLISRLCGVKDLMTDSPPLPVHFTANCANVNSAPQNISATDESLDPTEDLTEDVCMKEQNLDQTSACVESAISHCNNNSLCCNLRHISRC